MTTKKKADVVLYTTEASASKALASVEQQVADPATLKEANEAIEKSTITCYDTDTLEKMEKDW